MRRPASITIFESCGGGGKLLKATETSLSSSVDIIAKVLFGPI